MPYIKEVCVTGKIIEICKYHSARWNVKGGKRSKNTNISTELQERINQRQAAKNLRRLMNNNFVDDDYLIELDFRKELRPASSVEMQKYIEKFMRRLRTCYKKQEIELKYIYVKEVGKRGASHIHMMLSHCSNIIDVLKKCWEWGGIHIDPLNSDGQYEKIANYFIKYATKTAETEGRLLGKRYYASRNLVKPVVKKTVIKRVNTYSENIREKKGYYIEPDSVLSGVTKDGFDYFSYTLHALNINKFKDER